MGAPEDVAVGAIISAARDALDVYGQSIRDDQTAQDEANIQAANDAATAALADRDAVQAAFDAYVATHPDTPAQPLLIGTTYPGRERAAWNVVRTFNQTNALTVIRAGMLAATSYTPSLGGPRWSENAAIVSGLRSNLQGLPDVPGLRVCGTHEPEDQYLAAFGGDPDAASAQYVADENVFTATVRDVNQGRANPLTVFRCLMSYSLISSQAAARKPDLWMAGDYDECGIDVYGGKTRIDLAVAFAAKHGKPLCIPEMGPATGVAHTDPGILAYMQQAVAAAPDGNISWITWWDNAPGGDLAQYPDSLAYWKSQIAA